MRKISVIAAAALLVASSAIAALSKDEAKRLREAATILGDLRAAADKGIPEQLWDKAECVIVIPSVKTAALVVGGEYGSGVMSCRSKGWSNPAFMQLIKGSVGFQIGAKETDLVLLMMNRRGIDKLLEDKVTLGADMSVAAGPVGRTGTAATDAQMAAEMLSYSHSHGLFAGIDLSGGVLHPDKDAMARAYGPGVSARDVVLEAKPATTLAEAAPFIRALNTEMRATTGTKKK